ncbi:ABC transporter substrate-binding protein [Streptomyces uncialis]|uniref:ABC transporter substrate-binding protein n=1 Tax=Streptomyces uncialis TaxID=1048205 RepID=UPI0037AA351F
MTGRRRKRIDSPAPTRRTWAERPPERAGTATASPGPRGGGGVRTRPVALSAAALTVCGALAAACGVMPGTSAPSASTIKVMTWAPENTRATNMPGMPATARAYARWVNAGGGIDGRDLQVVTCNDTNDSSGARDCAQRAVDEDVVAVVGSYSQFGRATLPTLEAAGIPFIGGYGVTPIEFTSPASYPVHGGQPALMAGLGRQLADRCAHVTLVRPDTTAGDALPPQIDAGLAAGRRGPVDDVRAPEDASEYTAEARRSLTRARTEPGTGNCVAAALGERTHTFFDSFRRIRAGHTQVRVGSVIGSVDQSVVDRAGGASGPYEGALISAWYPVATDRRWGTMREVIREHAFEDNRVDPTDAGAQTTWVAYTVLKQVVESLDGGEVSARTVRRALDGGLTVGTGGLTPPLRWRFEDLLAMNDHPRIVNADVTFQTVRDGRLVAARQGFVNVSDMLEHSGRPG